MPILDVDPLPVAKSPRASSRCAIDAVGIARTKRRDATSDAPLVQDGRSGRIRVGRDRMPRESGAGEISRYLDRG